MKKYEIFESGEIYTWVKLYNWKTEKKIRIFGSKTKNGYLTFKYNGRWEYVHRIIASKFIPNPNNKPCVNHKNGDKTDNRAINLEWVTYSENHLHSYKILNRKTPLGRDYGGGVCFDKSRNKWMAYVGTSVNRKYLGRFYKKEDAEMVVNLYKEKYTKRIIMRRSNGQEK